MNYNSLNQVRMREFIQIKTDRQMDRQIREEKCLCESIIPTIKVEKNNSNKKITLWYLSQ